MTKNFGERLRNFRLMRNLSIADVARAIGVSQSTYRDWEYGRQIQGEPYVALARVFRIPLNALFLENYQGNHLAQRLLAIERAIHEIRLALPVDSAVEDPTTKIAQEHEAKQ